MIDVRISESGMQAIRDALEQFPRAVDHAAEDVADRLRELIRGESPVKSGHLKRSWSGVQRESGGFSFSTDVPYSRTLEEGGYEHVGPRTAPAVTMEGRPGIFSRQTINEQTGVGGLIGPFVSDERYLEPIMAMVVDQLKEILGVA